jgi:hypothetical protein
MPENRTHHAGPDEPGIGRTTQGRPTWAGWPGSELVPATRYLLDSIHDTAAYMVSARYDVLAWNRMATHFIGDLSVHAVEDRNLIGWRCANGPTARCGATTVPTGSPGGDRRRLRAAC